MCHIKKLKNNVNSGNILEKGRNVILKKKGEEINLNPQAAFLKETTK